MLDSFTYKVLQEKVGKKNGEVDQKSVLFASQGDKAKRTKDEFLRLLSQRNTPNSRIEEFKVYGSNVVFQLVEKTFQPNEKTITAVRIEPYGNDLLVTAHHFEISQKAISTNQRRGAGLLVGGLLFSWTGIGLVVMLIGIVFLVSKSRFPSGTAEYQSSKQHNQMVIESLLTALESCGVDTRTQLAHKLNYIQNDD